MSENTPICFKWSETLILHLQQTYHHIVMVFRAGKNVSPPFDNAVKGVRLMFVTSNLVFWHTTGLCPYYTTLCINTLQDSSDSTVNCM